jgi:hypothetical protein
LLSRAAVFYVYRGLSIFSKFSGPYPGIWQWIPVTREQLSPYMVLTSQLAHTKNNKEEQLLLDQIEAADIFHYQDVLMFLAPFLVLFRHWQWLPILALGSAGFLLWTDPKHRRLVSILVFLTFVHVILSNLAAPDPRYALPLEPLFIVLLVAGIDQWATQNWRGGHRDTQN